MADEVRALWVRWLDSVEERECDPDSSPWCPVESVGFYIGEDAIYLSLATSRQPDTVDRLSIPVGCILARQWLAPQ